MVKTKTLSRRKRRAIIKTENRAKKDVSGAIPISTNPRKAKINFHTGNANTSFVSGGTPQ